MDDWKRDYEDIKSHFDGTDFNKFRSGDWFAEFVMAVLKRYAENVDADYIRRMYPGARPKDQAGKLIELAAKNCALAGAASATAVSAAELSLIPTGGLSVPVVPATLAAATIGDVGYTSHELIRATYELSVLHKSPFSANDYEDCLALLVLAAGGKIYEQAGIVGKAIAPGIIAYNVRKLLRSGLRQLIVAIAMRVGGTQLAKQLAERTLMRLAVPGLSIIIGSSVNFFFVRDILQRTDRQLRRRGATVQPLLRLYKDNPDLDRMLPIKGIIGVVESGGKDEWSQEQMDVLRYCQSVLALDDADLEELDSWFDRSIDQVVAELAALSDIGAESFIDLLVSAAAAWPNEERDDVYAVSIFKVAHAVGLPHSDQAIRDRIRRLRRSYSS